MASVLAVCGFWLFLIVFVLRRPLRELIAARPSAADSGQIQSLKAQIARLETHVGVLDRELSEVKESNEFAMKLLNASPDSLQARNR